MARFGSLNRAAQKAYYDALSKAKTTLVVHAHSFPLPQVTSEASPRSQPGATTVPPATVLGLTQDAACRDTGLGIDTSSPAAPCPEEPSLPKRQLASIPKSHPGSCLTAGSGVIQGR